MELELCDKELQEQLNEIGFPYQDLLYRDTKTYKLVLNWEARLNYFLTEERANICKRAYLEEAKMYFREVHGIIIDVYSWKDHAADVNDTVEWKCFINRKVVYVHFKFYNQALSALLN
jgi:hypothetical protein